ncbi:DUF6578 domain-containing protein [Actinophytocola sp.]|uniref:DUF6578 domain-containing protein n=1 Tax=Actinophytocola sp. TaxID=1872138 RepID=UPI003D6B33AF
MRAIVWLDEWQQTCCGDPFEVGSVVTWSLKPPNTEGLRAILGPDEAQAVTHHEEHHDAEETPRVTGSVRSVRVVRCHSAPKPGEDPWTHYPVAESTVIEPVQAVAGYQPDRDGLSLVGYLVELNVDEPS